MNSDWNWFFSAVAQSSAAIVGIFTAFIFTKIINNNLEFNKFLRYLAKMTLESERLIEKAKATKIAQYNENLFKAERLAMTDALQRGEIKSPDEYIFRWKISPLMPKWYFNDKLKEYLRRFKQKSSTTGKSLNDLIKESETAAGMLVSHYRNLALQDEENINILLIEIRHNIREIKSLLEEISSNPQSSNLVTFSIIMSILLFAVGVVYPLSVLPFGILIGQNYYIRLVVLFSICIIYVLIMVIFLIINLRLKYPNDLIGRLESFCNLERYSPYFKEVEENIILK